MNDLLWVWYQFVDFLGKFKNVLPLCYIAIAAVNVTFGEVCQEYEVLASSVTFESRNHDKRNVALNVVKKFLPILNFSLSAYYLFHHLYIGHFLSNDFKPKAFQGCLVLTK